jgi:hypothetical protein
MNAQPAQFTLPFTHYAQLGYDPCPTTGKVPAYGEGWYTRQYTAEEFAALDKSSCNVGLRCSNVVGLDIDVPQAELAAKVEALCRKLLKLPKATPRRIGDAPKALLVVRVNAPTKGFDIKAKVEGRNTVLFQALGAGKQFVIHGIHPGTGKPYTLSAPLPKHAALKLVTVDDLVRLKAALLELFEAEGYTVRSTGAAGKAGSGKWTDLHPWSPTGMGQAQEALDGLDPDMCMDEWVQVGFALYDGTHGSSEGLALWDGWSSGSGKYKAGDCARRWAGFKAGGGVTKATLFRNDFPKLVAAPPGESPVRIERESDGDAPGISAADLFDFEAGEVPWIVQDVLTSGAHLLVGRPKGGKSWITLDMAYACGTGGTFLGKQARKTGVLWISAEDTKASLSRRLKVRGVRPPENIHVMTSENLKAERAKWEDCSFDAWLRGFLEAHPGIGLVIMDTHATIEATWAHEAIDEKRNASIVAQAYQMSRIYEGIGQDTECCIVLVHHAAKRKGKDITDYHELINLPATVVAGSTASLVLADPPDRDIHDEDDHRRVFAVRGRHIIGEAPLLIELKDAHANLLGVFHEIRQTEAQAEVLEAIEALLSEQDSTTIAEVASMLGKHRNTVQTALSRAAKAPGAGGKIVWKSRTLKISPKRGISWM